MTDNHQDDDLQVPNAKSPGAMLREARESLGLTQQMLADKLFLKINIIQELEYKE